MTHEKEICYWARHIDGTPVWVRLKDEWKLQKIPIWITNAKYIVDNKWAKLRKAQIDGKQLQYNYIDEGWTNEYFTLANLNDRLSKWRIKPGEHKEPTCANCVHISHEFNSNYCRVLDVDIKVNIENFKCSMLDINQIKG